MSTGHVYKYVYCLYSTYLHDLLDQKKIRNTHEQCIYSCVVCVFVHVYMHSCTHTYTQTHVRAHTHAHTRARMHTRTHTHCWYLWHWRKGVNSSLNHSLPHSRLVTSCLSISTTGGPYRQTHQFTTGKSDWSDLCKVVEGSLLAHWN